MGSRARKRKTPEQNPYPKPSDNNLERYTKHLAWGEGFVDTFFKLVDEK